VFSIRLANRADKAFLFELKKAAEFGPINAIFGWDDDIQQQLHQQEWAEEKPTIITLSGHAVGSYLLQNNADHFYFCRFFLLPNCQGKGIGSEVLTRCITVAEHARKPIKLCYLQGNRVGALYRRFGFQVTSEDKQFVYMHRLPIVS